MWTTCTDLWTVILFPPGSSQTTLDGAGFAVLLGLFFYLLSNSTYLEIKSVISIRHQVVFIGALELETMGDSSFRSPILSIATEVHEALIVTQLLEVFVVVSHYSIA